MVKKFLIATVTLSLFASIPAIADEWKTDNIGWYYQYDSGNYAKNGIIEINGEKYCFDSNGYMVTGWTRVNGEWHYCNSDGRMPAGCWIEDGEKWYYLNEDNTMRTGWYNDGKNEYYLYKAEDVGKYKKAVEGAMAKGTLTANGITYYFDASGKRVTSMKAFEDNGIWFRYKDGAFQWEDINNKGEWIQYVSEELFVSDIKEELIVRYNDDHTYTSSRKFQEEARLMLKSFLDEAEIEDYIDETLAEQWGESYRRKTNNDDDDED